MKKLLTLLLTLSGTASLPLSVIACGQADLDSNLNLVYQGDTKFTITELVPEIPVAGGDVSNLSLTQKQATELAKAIVTKAQAKDITWYANTLDVNQKCYNFNITNGTATDTDITWDAKQISQVTQRVNITISYEVGTVAQDKSFKATQKIDMSYYIKIGTSQSDKDLTTWITNFNDILASHHPEGSPLAIQFKDGDLPNEGTTWSDVSQDVVNATKLALANQFTWEAGNTVVFEITSTSADLITNETLKLSGKVSLNDAQGTTNSYYVQFQKITK